MTRLDLDPVLGSAVDLARAAVLEVAPADQVGEHLGVDAEGPAFAQHRFACTNRAYLGWHWSVMVVRTPDAVAATVSEVVLLPASGALLAPAWVPWSERVRAGDLGPGDLHPTAPEDPRLEPGFGGADALEEADDPQSEVGTLRPEQWQLGLGRERVLSVLGRDLAVERWYEQRGPGSPMAKAAPGPCTTCGFLLTIGGLVGQAFGVCANPLGADGSVVALEYGCGAHSSVREIEGTGIPVTEIVVDDYGFVEVHAHQLVEAPDELVTSHVVIAEDDTLVQGAPGDVAEDDVVPSGELDSQDEVDDADAVDDVDDDDSDDVDDDDSIVGVSAHEFAVDAVIDEVDVEAVELAVELQELADPELLVDADESADDDSDR